MNLKNLTHIKITDYSDIASSAFRQKPVDDLAYVELSSVPLSCVLLRFSWIFFLLASLFTALFLYLFQLYQEISLEKIEAHEHGYIEVSKKIFENEFVEIIGDLRMISKTPILESYLNQNGDRNKKLLANFLKTVTESHQRYFQIRLIDTQGQELIRVDYNNGDSKIVAKKALQDKSHRPYFKKTAELKKGQIYISNMELNMEYRQIQNPPHPVIRFATPLFDDADKFKGILIFNLDANVFLDDFRSIMENLHSLKIKRNAKKIRPKHIAMLLNTKGYWLMTNYFGMAWGFAFNKPDLHFGAFFPDEWPEISKSEKGKILNESGLFLFDAIKPLENKKLYPKISEIDDDQIFVFEGGSSYEWKIALLVPAEVLQDSSYYRHYVGQLTLFVAYLLLFLISLLIAYISLKQKYATNDLRKAAITDFLTGLYNRRYFSRVANSEMVRSIRYGKPLSLLIVDIDHFKHINDQYGHETGDRVLRIFGKTCSEIFREIDVICRFGGEEFTILLPDTDQRNAVTVAERLRIAAGALSIPSSRNEVVKFTVSIGVTQFNTSDSTIEDFIKRADYALYQAKNNGRNRVLNF